MYYLKLLEQEAIQNKYTEWYRLLCEKAKTRTTNRKDAKKILNYVEAHHIYPVSFNNSYKTDKNNIVLLSAKEHFIAHLLLMKMFVDDRQAKMGYALLQFGRNKENFTLTSKQFEFVRKLYSNSRIGVKRKPFSKEWKDNIAKSARKNYENGVSGINFDRAGSGNGMFGKTHSETTRKKMAKKKQGLYDGSSNPMFGKTHSEGIKQAQSERAKGTVWINNGLESKKMKLENAQQFLANGWNRGRAMDHRASEKYLLALLDKEKPIE